MYPRHSSFRFPKGIKGWISTIIASLVLLANLTGQSRAKLNQNQSKLKAQIALTQKQINKIDADKVQGLARYNALDTQIKSRNALIESIQSEMTIIEEELITQETDITLIKSQYDSQRERYKRAIKNYYKFRSTYTPIAFVFSSTDLITAWNRISFYQRLSRYHKDQVAKIKDQEDELLLELNLLKEINADKQVKLEDLLDQKNKLIKDQTSRKRHLEQLKRKEASLQTKLVAQEKQSAKLTALMRKLVEASVNEKTKKKLPTAAAKLSDAFGANKGKLPWPVTNGYIAKRFGKRRHPDLKMIYINNNGIDIVTNEAAEVVSVFAGKVMAVQEVAGFNNTILISHDGYYTVYANVENVTVRTGEVVKRGQTLAYVASSDAGTSIHFELWKGKELQNPSLWLRTK